MLPDRIDPKMKEYDMLRQAGFAEFLIASNNIPDGGREYDRLRSNYEKELNVQYAYGRYQLVARDEDGALVSFGKEIQYHPEHILARLQIAYIYLNRKQPEQGLPFARDAVKLSPRFAYCHMILGRLLFDSGDNDGAIKSLETAAAMLPTEPKIYYTLARAYDKAKRKADAQRARETFARLSKDAENAAGANSVGPKPGDPNAPERP
jgi:predicted Zn-dependent protease